LNPGTFVIINLLGGVALLLWGVRMVRTGVMRAWGDRLKYFIEHRLGSRLSAFLAGGMATAILGSGTATSLIVANIAVTGAIPAALGLAVLLGADVGSAVVSSVFASGSGFALWASPLFLFGGYVTFNASREFRPHNVGRILIGLGLMLLSLKLISQATTPLKEATLFHDVLTALGHEPLLAFLVGALMAWSFHSTLAAVLLIASFASNGSIDLAGAVYFILGINFGGGLPALSSSLALPAVARRLPVANLLCRGLAAVLVLALAEYLLAIPVPQNLGTTNLALAFHTVFNVVAGLFFLPLVGPIGRLVKRLIPDEAAAQDTLAAPRYLEVTALSSPPIALANALMETVRMSEVLDTMFNTAFKALNTGSVETLKQLRLLDDRLNAFQTAIQTYLADLSQGTLSEIESRKALEITLYVSNLEHAGDIIQLNLADRIKAKVKEGIAFTTEEQASLDDLCLIIHTNVRLATGVLNSGDVEGAKRLIAQKDAFRALENKVLDEHFRKGSGNRKSALRRSALYVDMVRDLHRINAHIVAAGYPIVDAAGLLRQSRLRQNKK
jgi:phosphate:Na+ symporter